MRRIDLLALSCLLGGCASLSSFQEARALEKGRWTASLPVELDDFEPHGSVDSEGGARLLSPQLGIRYGWGDGLDIGLRTTLLVFTGVSVDAKRQWIGRDSLSSFQVSSGIKAAYAREPDLKGRDKLEKYNAFDLIIPLYLGWTPSRMLGITLTPEFCYRFSTDDSHYSSGPILGANLDLRLGHRWGVVLESGSHRVLDHDIAYRNFGFSLFAGF